MYVVWLLCLAEHLFLYEIIMNFKHCAEIFHQLEQESSRLEMTKNLAQFLNQCSAQEVQIIAYLAMGSLFPPYKDKQFNIASKGMNRIVAMLLDIPEDSVEKKVKTIGDVGSVAYDLWNGKDFGLTIVEVYQLLVEIALVSGTGSTEQKSKMLIDLLQQCDAVGVKMIVKIVSKTMRLGFSDMTFIDALSWMETGSKKINKTIEHAYNICADLGLVAATLKTDGVVGLKKMHIQVGIPIRPAAAERLSSPQAIVEKLGPCVAQPKLDGFRVQVHVQKTNKQTGVHFFSRNMLDMSDMFPDLTKLVAQLPVKSLICEGEAIVYDEQTDTFLPFQQTVKRKRKHDVEAVSQELPLRLYIFDLLYLNGVSMLDQTHAHRRIMLEQIIDNKESSLQVIGQKHITTAQELQDYFLSVIGSGLEGLVVKREDAIYQPGKRNFNWIKLKRDSHGFLLDTIDGVILGYYVGRGKRAQFGIGAFLLGVYDSTLDSFVTVAKVGTGLKDEEFKILKKKCDALKLSAKPHNVLCAKELTPDVWIAPEIVCVVQSEEITLSPLHTAAKKDDNPGLALRFPRFIEYRYDKSASDATTVRELQRLYQEQKT